MATYSMHTPLTSAQTNSLRAGDIVYLSGCLFTARDAAHKLLFSALEKGEPLPFDPQGAVIYYVGPTPAPEGRAIGSAGPTTSGRMDSYTPRLYDLGLKGTIGKGKRNQNVIEALGRNSAVYFGATGGAGALLSECIIGATVIAYGHLGTEAIRRLEVNDFPLLVINDAHGGELYAIPKR